MNNPTPLDDEKYRTLLTYTIAGCFCFFVLAVTSCTAHMNMYNDGEAKADLEQIRAAGAVELEASKNAHIEEMERIASIQRLVDETKYSPIAAKCAIDGWEHMNSADVKVCEEAARSTPIILNSNGAE